jgi:hypothetical protein
MYFLDMEKNNCEMTPELVEDMKNFWITHKGAKVNGKWNSNWFKRIFMKHKFIVTTKKPKLQ